jgi:hypothetical protein
VDLKDKWRNITKAIGQHKKMRGFNMAADLVLRVQNCMRVAAVGSPCQPGLPTPATPAPHCVRRGAIMCALGCAVLVPRPAAMFACCSRQSAHD